MAKTGTLEEVMEKLYDLYLENRIGDVDAKHYLLLLRHEDAEHVYTPEDADALLELLRRDKEEVGNYPVEEKGEKE